MEKKASSRNTKSEILKQYDELFLRHQKLEKQAEQLAKEKKKWEEKKPQPPEPKSPVIKKEENTVETNKEKITTVATSMEKIVQNLKTLQVNIGSATNELSAQLVSEASQLAEITLNNNETKLNLESVHNIQPEMDTLQKLILEYDEKSELFQLELKQKQQEHIDKISNLKKSWHKDQEDYTRTIRERDETEKLTLKREADEYEYELQRKRYVEGQKHLQKIKNLKKELQKIELAKKNEWEIREQKISEQEQELENLKSQVDNFDKQLEKEIKTVKEQTSTAVKKEIQTKADLLAKEVKGEHRIYETKIISLEGIIQKQALQIQSLNTQLNTALKQSQDLALKAIEGASNASSFLSMKEIAMEQAKNIQKRQ